MMEITSIFILIALVSVIPYTIVVLLKFFLWKFSFTARVNGFFTFSEIMLRVPLHLNFSILFRIERLSVSFSVTSRMLKISTYGFQISLLVRNDFNIWATKKIEILQMLEDIRTTLKRKGFIKSTLMQAASAFKRGVNVEYFGHAIKEAMNLDGGQGASQVLQNSAIQNHQKKLLERMIDKILTSFEVKMTDTLINFWCYKDEDKKIEEGNIKKFYTQYLLEPSFRDEYLCFRVFIPNTDINVKSLNDEEMDLFISGDQVLLQNPKSLNKQGILKEVTLLIKVPLDLKLAQDFCHYDVRITILRACLNLNKKVVRSITKFLVCLDTTKVIISRIKRLIIKLHYQDEFLTMMQQPRGTTGVETLYKSSDTYNYENILDEDIPKRLKVVIEQGLTLMVSEYSKTLKPFLNGGCGTKPEENGRQSEQVVISSNQFTFELLRTLKNSYYLSSYTEKLAVDCNMKRSITIEKFFQETDFSYKRPITDLPITISKMEISNTIKADSVNINLTYSEVKLILDIIDIYQEMVHIASVKNIIMSTLLDKEFLKSNLLHLGNSQEDLAKEQQIMLLFQEPKFKDSLINDVFFEKLSGKFHTYDPKNAINIMGSKYQMRLKVEKNVDEFTHKLGLLNIQPVSQKSISLLKLQGMENTMVITRGHESNIEQISTNFDKCHICLNMDYILELTREIVDLSIICKTYARRWNFKYKVKEFIKQTVIEALSFQFNETQFIWYMSTSRFVVFRAANFKTKPVQCPFKKDDKIGLCYFASEFSMYHVLLINDSPIPGSYFCAPSEEKKVQPLIDTKEFELKMFSNQNELQMRFTAKSFDSNIPDDVHFSGLIFEMVKQIMVSKKWFNHEYIKVKRKYNVQYMKPPETNLPQFSISGQMVPATSGRGQTLYIQVEVQDVVIQAEDSDIKQIFVNKNEIVDTMHERDIFKCKGQNIFKLIKRLKESKLNEKSLILQGKNFRMTYDLPKKFLDFNQVYQIIQKLDEAKEFLTPNIFTSFESAIHHYKCDYLSMHARNLIAPLMEAWDVDVKFLMIAGLLNADLNPALFKTKIYDKIFNKYEVQYHYNKLLPKMFYDAELKITKFRLSIQGQQSLLIFSDFGNIFSKFDYVDISKSKDPRGQKLSYYTGLDFMRHKMHGKTKLQVIQSEIIVYPKRKFNRYDSYMNLQCSDIFYSQIHNLQELSVRNFMISKHPSRHFESAIMKIPLVEIQLNIIYNQGKAVNHYTHVGVQTIGQLLDQLKTYSSHEVELESKINIPSLGTRNDSDRDSIPISEILPQYVQLSPIPILHYQRSHMKFFDQLLSEYVKKTSYSNPIPLKRDRLNSQNIKNKRAYLFKIRIKSLMNDLMILFSDFKERLTDGYFFENQQRLDPKTLRFQRDKYLAIYQGIMFTMENLSLKSQISVSKVKDGTHIEMKNSGIESHFMKLAFMTSSNLFQIRHQCFKQLRDKKMESSLDNLKNFQNFFEIYSGQSSLQNQTLANYYQELQANSILANFKTISPQYVLRTPMLQQEIMIATLNPNSMNPLSHNFADESDPNYCRHQTILDDFVFSNTDTIQTTICVSYSQDQDISFYHNSTAKMEERQQNNYRAAQQNPLILDVMQSQHDAFEEERFTVKHMIDIKGIRFLYTKQTVELIIHHLINSFDYEKYRKTDFIDIENSGERYHAAGGKRHHHHNDHSSSNSRGDSTINQTPINVKTLRKVALIGIRIEDPQFNFQNQFTKSQMLLSTALPTTAIIFGYHKFGLSQQQQAAQFSPSDNDNVTKTKSGYHIKFHEELVKVDLQIQVVEMDIYVAPTVINLENPTFWISNMGYGNVVGVCIQQQEVLTGTPSANPGAFSNKNSPRDQFQVQSENLLRKIFTVTNISFTFDFFFAQFVDVLNPVMAIDILVEKLTSEMSGPNMWHFIYVLKSILFDRGEKADEILLTEQMRMKQMREMKLDLIKSLINYKINQMQGLGAESAKQNNIINKKIQYTIINGEFKLLNFDSQFSRMEVNHAMGTHLIYKNRNTKVDIDIDKILIENYADGEEYRIVLSPQVSPHNVINDPHAPSGDAMIKIRTRDKHVVVKDTVWQVFDQFEVFIFPTSIQFTRNFYQQIRDFFFAEMPNFDLDKSMEEIKKYEMLVPQKVMKKAKAKLKAKAVNDPSQEKMILSALPNNNSVLLHTNKVGSAIASDGNFQRQLNAAMHINDSSYFMNDYRREIPPQDDNVVKTEQAKQEFPIFFRYTRMNEIMVSITYFHEKNSFFNSKDLKIKLTPFIKHQKFNTFKRLFEKYENQCKKNFIRQIPSLIKQKLLQSREILKGGVRGAVGHGDAIDDDEDDEKLENKKEIRLANAKKILFGEYSENC